MIIHSISGPRNISTALMYSFAQRMDTRVYDEPFYGAYLHRRPELVHPGRELTMREWGTNVNTIVTRIREMRNLTPVVFLKDMAHHFTEVNLPPFPHSKVLMLIRNPERLIASFQKVIPEPTLQDIGLADESALYRQFVASNIPVVVVNTAVLASNPADKLPMICEALGLPFTSSMLSWPQGPKPYDGPWQEYWYKNVHRSSGFTPFSEELVSLDNHGKELLEQAMPHYEFLLQHSIL